MLIVCPNCATSYLIDQAALGPAGRVVRCARCKTSWFAGGPEPQPELTAPADSAVAQAPSAPNSLANAPAPPAAAVPPDAPAAEGVESAAEDDTEAPPTPTEAPVLRATEVQAEPVDITDAPPLVPPIQPYIDSATATSDDDGEEVESFDARRQWLQARRKQSRRSSRWTALVLVLVAGNVALIGARNEVVHYLPQTGSLFASIGLPVNLRNLKFEDVKLTTEADAGVNMLTVQGAIASEADRPVAVPRLRFALRNTTGQDVYSWTMQAPRSILEPGERLPFRSRIPAPKVDAADVMVRFLTAQDAGAK